MLLPEARRTIAECAHLLNEGGHTREAVLMIAIFQDLSGAILTSERTGVIRREFELAGRTAKTKKRPLVVPPIVDDFQAAVNGIYIPPAHKLRGLQEYDR
mgnify:CR=1 FL=1